MRLFIFNSNYKSRLWVLCILTLILYIMINIFGYVVDYYSRVENEKKYLYRGDVIGKSALLMHLYQGSRPDIVFIGNSLTKFHISTSHFYKSGINIFNYGIAGHFVGQYPDMINNAIKSHPKIIAISIRKSDLYLPFQHIYTDYNHKDDLSIFNIYFLAKHTEGYPRLYLVSQFIASYLYNCNYFIATGNQITHYLKETVHRYRHGNSFAQKTPIDKILKCDFNSSGEKICQNGDDVLIGKNPNEDEKNRYKTQYIENYKFNYVLANILNNLFDQIKRAGIKPILIIIPTLNPIIGNDELLTHTIHAEIFDMTAIKMADNCYWSKDHYNIKGRQYYSHALLNKIKPLLQADKHYHKDNTTLA